MKIYIAFLQILPGKNLNENLIIGKKACIEAKEKGADILADVNVKGIIGGKFVHW